MFLHELFLIRVFVLLLEERYSVLPITAPNPEQRQARNIVILLLLFTWGGSTVYTHFSCKELPVPAQLTPWRWPWTAQCSTNAQGAAPQQEMRVKWLTHGQRRIIVVHFTFLHSITPTQTFRLQICLSLACGYSFFQLNTWFCLCTTCICQWNGIGLTTNYWLHFIKDHLTLLVQTMDYVTLDCCVASCTEDRIFS